ncbi:MAG: amidophosphoribosyltransferase [Bacteroidota bacterium]|nr:amidophosphoribosyltransferase [Bacteroidota bacterium]
MDAFPSKSRVEPTGDKPVDSDRTACAAVCPGDKPQCNCGVVGVYGDPQAATLVYYGLHALQHRGQEAAGIVAVHRERGGAPRLRIHKGRGLVTEVFSDAHILSDFLAGDVAIGHNRYSTTGSDNLENIQPFMVTYRDGQLAVAHNGNLTNTRSLRKSLQDAGTIFQTGTDTEVFLHLTARSQAATPEDRIIDALNSVRGAFSLVIMHGDTLIAARDPFGFRPLCLGRRGKAWVVASESCALDIMKADYVRDVEPGEVLFFDGRMGPDGEPRRRTLALQPERFSHCIFEYIYFSRPDSIIFGEKVDKIRRRLGKMLAHAAPVPGTPDDPVLIMAVPDSSNTAAIGYVRSSGKMGIDARFEIGLIRSHYIGRTFIQPGQEKREMNVRLKFNTVKGVIEGRKVLIIDDSIVRGTTSRLLINLVREARPREIHVRISSPMIVNPCPYGMDFPSREELVAVQCGGDVERIRKEIGADSLAYLSLDALEAVVDHSGKRGYCTACFGGVYPVPPEPNMTKEEHER